MPPVRWKQLLFVAAISIYQIFAVTDAQRNMQDAISISADGWRPIVGTRRQPPAFGSDVRITQYKNPSQVEILKAETKVLSSSTTTVSPDKSTSRSYLGGNLNNINSDHGTRLNGGSKIPPHTKHAATNPHYQHNGGYHTIPTATHTPKVVIKSVTPGRPLPLVIKKITSPPPPRFQQQLHSQQPQKQKLKPVRGPVGQHSTREEVYVPPGNPGSYQFINHPSSNVKIREAQGLGLLGTNHYSVNQPHAHIEFTNRFPPSNGNFEQYKSNPVTYIFSKGQPQQFKNQNDEYTRNLVPPPRGRIPQDKQKLKNVPKLQDNVIVPSVTEAVINFDNFAAIKNFGARPQIHENLVPFGQNFGFPSHQYKPKDQVSDVQVTKENVKYHHPVNSGGLSNFRSPGLPDFGFDFRSTANPGQPPRLQTYEVTEGKWIDNPNPFTYNFQRGHTTPQRGQHLTQGTARPEISQQPIVELNLPPFLPTPYSPEGTVPSPTQSDAAAVFSQVTNKMNKYKNDALTTNPMFFDIKEVSTHYPILGNPEFQPNPTQTDTPLPMNENGEINEITTQQQREEITTQRPKTRRRRPQPRRTTTTSTTTTTTTEEPARYTVVENYESQKTQQDISEQEMSTETERPYRRQRPRPNRYRDPEDRPNRHKDSEERPNRLRDPEDRPNRHKDSEERPNRLRDSEDRPSRHRTQQTTSEDEDSTEKRNRGRYRFRQRGGQYESSEYQNAPVRKRVRPTTTESPYNHRPSETEPSIEQNFESESFVETQETFAKKVRPTQEAETEVYNGYKEEEQPTRYYETTPANELSVVTPYVEVTEKATAEPVTEAVITTIHSAPENEVDFSTSQPHPEQIFEHQTVIISTLPPTTMPSTTTTTEEPSSTKATKSRGRPMKYNTANRPRFSVKDYRQRLNQYTSTTPSSTTDLVRTTSEGPKIRFPGRLRTRPTATTTTTVQPYSRDEEGNTEPIFRRKFKPKDPRHQVSTTESTNANIITETSVKAVNPRLRPFGRFRTTTESSESKVSIKTDLFNVARRRNGFNTRTKLRNKNVTEDSTTVNEIETTEPVTTQAPVDENQDEEISTKIHRKTTEPSSTPTESNTEVVSEDDYSQRVSELTSSFKNEGYFKSLSSNTRRIPSHFTISTEDPRLPIEAFFPNIKEKENNKDDN